MTSQLRYNRMAQPTADNRAYLATVLRTPAQLPLRQLQIRSERYMKFRTSPLKRKAYSMYEIKPRVKA